MNPDDLIVLAREMVRPQVGRPRQVSLKRSVSSAYYALLHGLARECVTQTIGWHFAAPRYWQSVVPIYRAIEHGAARQVFTRLLNDATASESLRELARLFIDLQAERIRADYDPRPMFTQSGALSNVSNSERALHVLRFLNVNEKRELAALLVTRQR